MTTLNPDKKRKTDHVHKVKVESTEQPNTSELEDYLEMSNYLLRCTKLKDLLCECWNESSNMYQSLKNGTDWKVKHERVYMEIREMAIQTSKLYHRNTAIMNDIVKIRKESSKDCPL